MCCKNLRKTYIPFLLAFLFGSLMVNIFTVDEISLNHLEKKFAPSAVVKEKSDIYQNKNTGRGSSGHSCNPNHYDCITCKVCKDSKFANSDKLKPKNNSDSNSTPIKLLSKPQPPYTKEARTKYFEGETILRITFLANGQIGSISPVSQLPYGLTEQAIEAARKIKFEPAMRNGQPISVTKSLKYAFTIY